MHYFWPFECCFYMQIQNIIFLCSASCKSTCGHIHQPFLVPVKHPFAKVSRLEVDCWSWPASVSVLVSQEGTFAILSHWHLFILSFGDVTKHCRCQRINLYINNEASLMLLVKSVLSSNVHRPIITTGTFLYVSYGNHLPGLKVFLVPYH